MNIIRTLLIAGALCASSAVFGTTAGCYIEGQEDTYFAKLPALHKAAAQGWEYEVKRLIGQGVHVDERFVHQNNLAYPNEFDTPLMLACRYNQVEMVKLLLAAGANPNQKSSDNSKDGALPITMTTSLEVMQLLLSAGAQVNDPGRTSGHSPLSRFVFNIRPENEQVIRLLLSYGADINERALDGVTLLHCCCSADFLHDSDFCQLGQRIRLLLTLGADVNAVDNCGRTPLHYALGVTTLDPNCYQIHAVLIAAGADLDKKDEFDITPRMLMNRLEIERNRCLMDGDRAALLAASLGIGELTIYELCLLGNVSEDSAYLNFYIKSGARERVLAVINESSCESAKKVISAFLASYNDLLQLAVKHGFDINQVNQEGMTPLHAALSCLDQGDFDINDDTIDAPMNLCRTLVQLGADVNAADKDGVTPLHLAVRYLVKHDVRLTAILESFPVQYRFNNDAGYLLVTLLEYGADLDKKNKDGITPRALLSDGLKDIGDYHDQLRRAGWLPRSGSKAAQAS